MKQSPESLSAILVAMAQRLLRKPDDVPSSEAAHVVLMFANFAWNETVGLGEDRSSYRPLWEPIEAHNPLIWDEFKSNDVEAMLDELVAYKKKHHPDDLRRILVCGMPEDKVRVEWLPPVVPGVDSKMEMKVTSLVRLGDRDQAIQLLRKQRGISQVAAIREVQQIATRLGLPTISLTQEALKRSLVRGNRLPSPFPSPSVDPLRLTPHSPAPEPAPEPAPFPAHIPVPKPKPKAKSRKKKPALDAELSSLGRIGYQFIGISVEFFCQRYLNDEYTEVCLRLTDYLARAYPAKITTGDANIWAAGIVRTIGWVNFLDNPSQKPHLDFNIIDRGLDVKEKSATAKLLMIRKLLDIDRLDPAWTLPSKMDQNPLVWNIDLDGFIIDVRKMPLDFQEEALRRGLIPYIPKQ